MLDEVPVLTDDLKRIKESLNAAYYKCIGEDLVEQYRTLNTRPRSAPLTKDLETTIEKVDAYLIEATKEKEEEDDVQ